MMLFIYLIYSLFLFFYYLPHVYQYYASTYFEMQGERSVVKIPHRIFLFMLSFIILYFFSSFYHINKAINLYYLLIPLAISISYFDLKFRVIPDRFHLMSICLIAPMIFMNKPEINGTLIVDYGFAFIFIFFLISSNFIYAKFRKQDGIGWGDIKLLLWMMLVLKEAVVGVFFVSVLLSLIFYFIKRIVKKGEPFGDSFAFAPYLMGVFLVVLFSV